MIVIVLRSFCVYTVSLSCMGYIVNNVYFRDIDHEIFCFCDFGHELNVFGDFGHQTTVFS